MVKQQPGGSLIAGLHTLWDVLPAEVRRATKDFFGYSVDFIPLAAGATGASANIQIQADSHFLIMQASRVVTDVANTTFVDPVPQLVRVFDSGSGRDLVNIDTHIDNYFGTAQLPSYWPFPKLIKASSTLTTTLTNLDGANARNVRITYLGFKIFLDF